MFGGNGNNWGNPFQDPLNNMGNLPKNSDSQNPFVFQEIGRQINLLVQLPDSGLPNISPILIEEKYKLFKLIHNNIRAQRDKFLKNFEEISYSIDQQLGSILMLLQARQNALKDELRKEASEKVATWNRQLENCENILEWLRLLKTTKDTTNLQEIRNLLNTTLTEDFENIESGDIMFEIGEEKINMATVAFQRPLNNLGRIVYKRDMRIIAPKFIIGERGEEGGQFCRPWGVCTDTMGHIFVSDRSNHRIQIFNELGEYIFHFGTEGSRPGEFNRPAGIAVNKQNQIVVSDKDNHRIQIFTFGGRLLRKFGSQGSGPGEFLYPWGVAVNSKCEIAVCDSKNHRIQLFNECGGFLKIFDGSTIRVDRPRARLKFLDSPRDVAFLPDDSLVLTDFNNHRVLIIDKNLDKYKSLGGEGSIPGRFLRPQGIACDSFGRIAIADCKNYRIQVFNASNNLIKMFGCQGDAPGQFDCPQGISFHPNGSIVVVDFKNDRVQVF